MEKQLKWSNLKLNKCPDCGKTFSYASFSRQGYIVCATCNFTIRASRFQQIVSSQINARIERELSEEYNKNKE